MKNLLILIALIGTSAFSQSSDGLINKAKQVGVNDSARCWVASVYAQNVFTNNDVPDRAENLNLAETLTNLYNKFGVALVGQNSFNSVINRYSSEFKGMSTNDKTKLWLKCVDLWK